jgi:hypothetical protein
MKRKRFDEEQIIAILSEASERGCHPERSA